MNRINRGLAFYEKRVYWLLVFLFPTQLSYHFWPNFSFIFGIKVDYLSPTVYLTDLLVILLVILSCSRFILFVKGIFKKRKSKLLILSLLGIGTAIVVANILKATTPPVAVIKWIKIIELLILALYAYINKKSNKETLYALYYSVTFFSLIGILQFVLQKTIGGPLYLLGERHFSLITPGIALAKINGVDYLRAYSTFPHPNAFAGYLGVGVVLITLMNCTIRLFNKKQLWLFYLVSSIAFFLTFSSGALVAGSITAVYFLLNKKNKEVNCNGINAIDFVAKKRFKLHPRFNRGFRLRSAIKTKIVQLLFLLFICLSLTTPVFWKLYGDKISMPESVGLRLAQAEAAMNMFKNHALWGVGLNNFILSVRDNTVVGTSLFIQPAHNVYLLLLTEIGTVGFIFFVAVVLLTSNNLNRKYVPIFIYILITSFVDHYWLTLQQNLLLLFFVLGISLQKENR